MQASVQDYAIGGILQGSLLLHRINPFTAAVIYIVPTKCGPILRVYYI